MALRFRQRDGIRLVLDRLRQVEHHEDAVDGRHRALERAIDAGQALDRICEVDGIRQERDERTCRHDAVDDLVAAEPDDERHGKCGQKLDRRRQQTRQADVLHGRLEIQLVLLAETVDFIPLAHERFHDADGRDAFLQERCNIRHALLDQCAVALELAAENLHRLPDERDDDERQQRQLPVEHDHHDDGADENRALRHHLDEVRDERRLDGRDIVRDEAHRLARLMLVKIRHRHALELAEHRLAHVDDDFLSNIRDEIALPVVEDAAEQEHDDDADCDEVQHHHVLVHEHLVDHVLDDPGQVQIRRRRHDNAENGEAEAFEIRLDVREKPLVILHERLLPFFVRWRRAAARIFSATRPEAPGGPRRRQASRSLPQTQARCSSPR